MILLKIFLGFLQVGLFTFGGGYASLPLVREQVLQGGWMSPDEFTDLLAISQMTPGPIAINTATFVGLKTAGAAGAVVASFAFILPSVVFVSALAYLYRRYSGMRAMQNALSGVRPAATGLILAAALDIVFVSVFGLEIREFAYAFSKPDVMALILVCAGVVALRVLKAPILPVIAACGAAGGIAYSLPIG